MKEQEVIYDPNEIDGSYNYKMYNDTSATYNKLKQENSGFKFNDYFGKDMPKIVKFRCLTDYLGMTVGFDHALRNSQAIGMELWHELKPEIIKTGKEKEAEMMEKAMQFYNPALMLKRIYGDALKVDEGIIQATDFMLGNGEELSEQSKKILGIVIGAKDYLQSYNPYGYNGFDTEHAISALIDRGLPHELIINSEGIKREDLKKFDEEKGKFKTVNLPMIKYDFAGEDMPTRMFTPPK